MLPGAEGLHRAEPLAEGDLRGVVDVQVAEDQGPVGLQGLERPRGQRLVGQELLAVDAGDLRADGGAELRSG